MEGAELSGEPNGPTAAAEALIATAEAMRPTLLEEQATTEERTFYSEEIHSEFEAAGFYRMLIPRRYGGLEVDLPTFYRVIVAISRGCPSTGWMLALGCAHALQAASYFGQSAQDDFFSPGRFIASASFGYQDALAEPVDDGYRVSGLWHFCSGVPYATHHMALVPVQGGDEPIIAVVPRESFRMLDNWGDLIGLRGSGSHSVAIEGAVIPRRHTITLPESLAIGVTTTPGYRLHGNPMYGGSFMAVVLGELNSVQVGNAQGAVDEYERLLTRPTRRVAGKPGSERSHDPNYQRILGLALSCTDAAHSILMQCGALFHEYAAEAMQGGRPFDAERTSGSRSASSISDRRPPRGSPCPTASRRTWWDNVESVTPISRRSEPVPATTCKG